VVDTPPADVMGTAAVAVRATAETAATAETDLHQDLVAAMGDGTLTAAAVPSASVMTATAAAALTTGTFLTSSFLGTKFVHSFYSQLIIYTTIIA